MDTTRSPCSRVNSPGERYLFCRDEHPSIAIRSPSGRERSCEPFPAQMDPLRAALRGSQIAKESGWRRPGPRCGQRRLGIPWGRGLVKLSRKRTGDAPHPSVRTRNQLNDSKLIRDACDLEGKKIVGGPGER
ncbi:unnamed protein product [Macrosiphum euphorbiae]|uniref:Uncharacterized protein n=1 Tax=Macrosiphum euphorbiae TaxID=13131 RepID=A0AAV0WND0_9HEMI|nr:unnamed protein product [Macrosiphum euphorbiae]